MAVAPLSVSASIRSDFVIVKPFDLYPRSRTRLNLGATMPIASSRNIVGINIDAGFRTAPDRVPSAEAGGVFAPDIGERIVDALFGLRYYSPVAVIDRPLPFGYHLESLRGELFAEAYASALPGISFEHTLYFGAEFEIGFGKTAHLPFGLGIVFRIPLDDVFTPADDIRIYVSSSSILGAFNSK